MTYSMSDVKRAGRLWDEMPLGEVADQMDIAESTLWRWSSMDLISTDTNHLARADEAMIQRADELYDVMPLRRVADEVGVCERTAQRWRKAGLISTDKDWLKINGGREKKTDPRRVIEMYHEKEMTQQEVADQVGVSRSTVSRYIRQYRNGNL